MIRAIAAIDSHRGMADDDGIPWDLPSDQKYFVEKLKTGRILMGEGTYEEVERPFGVKGNYVATRLSGELRPGFIKVDDARKFLMETKEDLWIIGGPSLFSRTIDLIDELYITQVRGDFNCSKFMPEFRDRFQLVSDSDIQKENDILFSFQVWAKKQENPA